MEFIRNLKQLRPRHRGCVATIGNFDGVHRGHQTLLLQLINHAERLKVPTTVMLFEPQPQEFFAPEQAPARLTRLREKLMALQLYGVDRVLCLRFNQHLAALSADGFIQQILVDGLQVKHLVIGDDFHFGRQRQGNFNTLKNAGEQYGFSVENRHSFLLDDERVSSTRIRQALAVGDMRATHELLGRPYTICGRVGYGQQRGRTIGFPTANIALHRAKAPISGVFAVYLHGLAGRPLAGIANLGTRPTVQGNHSLLEVHIFDFNQVIYGDYVEVEFVSKIREERRFESFEALKQQIQDDVILARQALLPASS